MTTTYQRQAYKNLRKQGYCALFAYVATFQRTPGIPLIYGPDPQRPRCRYSWFALNSHNWRRPIPMASPEHVPADIALGEIQHMAHAARLGRIKPLTALCRRVLGRQACDIDDAARARLMRIWTINIPEAHRQVFRAVLGEGGDLAYLVGYMVKYGDAACELGHAFGWLTLQVEAFKDVLDPDSEQFEDLCAAYGLEIFAVMAEEADRRRGLESVAS